MSWQRTALVTTLLCTLPISFAAAGPILKFESAEHIAAGNHVKLYFAPDDPGRTGTSLPMPNGLNLTYGELVSLGDFYGIVGQPISDAASDTERRKRFNTAFDSFAKESAAQTEIPKILDVARKEQKALDEGMQKGEKPEDIYARIGGDNNRQWNCVTGGGCSSMWWSNPGRYLQLAQQDMDHFGEEAWQTYQTGHQIALETAIEAHKNHNVEQLKLAYAINGFASHFLSDRFASGHMRTPRSELPANVTPGVLGSLLSSFMHTEENQSGLHVHNARGDHWLAYGDRYYYDLINATNRKILDEVMQKSVDQVFAAYQHGVAPQDNSVSELLPITDETGKNSAVDITPLFYWDGATKTLYRRADISNLYDHHWSSDWWGWTTLILLTQKYSLPTEAQAQLVSSGYAEDAMRYGLITDKQVLDYAKSQGHS